VSAVFYLYIALNFLEQNVLIDGQERPDATHLAEVLNVVVWFMIICSVVSPPTILVFDALLTVPSTQLGHGLTIPVGKLGLYLPRTISHALSTHGTETSLARHSLSSPSSPLPEAANPQALQRRVWRLGGSTIPSSGRWAASGRSTNAQNSRGVSPSPDPDLERQGREVASKPVDAESSVGGQDSSASGSRGILPDGGGMASQRVIRFPDEERGEVKRENT
jgi:hypothetical protein